MSLFTGSARAQDKQAPGKPTIRPKSGSPSPGKAAPSLSETTAWIKDALASYGHVSTFNRYASGWTSSDDFTDSLVSADSCRLVLHRVSDMDMTDTQGASYVNHSESVMTVKVGDLDPASAKLTEVAGRSDQAGTFGPAGFAIGYNTTNLAQLIEVDRTIRSSHPGSQPEFKQSNEQSSGISLRVSNKDIATRLMKAMSHAVELCGGKKSLF